VVIDLQKPYTKTEVGVGLVMYGVFLIFAMWMFNVGSKYLEYTLLPG
jgi:hypothetical protein